MPEGRGRGLDLVLTTAENSMVFFKISCSMAFRKANLVDQQLKIPRCELEVINVAESG
jgi:hypothetical protein